MSRTEALKRAIDANSEERPTLLRALKMIERKHFLAYQTSHPAGLAQDLRVMAEWRDALVGDGRGETFRHLSDQQLLRFRQNVIGQLLVYPGFKDISLSQLGKFVSAQMPTISSPQSRNFWSDKKMSGVNRRGLAFLLSAFDPRSAKRGFLITPFADPASRLFSGGFFSNRREKGAGLTRRQAGTVYRSLPSAFSVIGADIVTGNWERLRERTPGGFMMESGLAMGGNIVGSFLSEQTFKAVPGLAKRAFVRGAVGRIFGLAGSVAALGISSSGPISIPGFGVGAIVSTLSGLAVHTGIQLTSQSSLLRRLAVGLRLAKAGGMAAGGLTGGATFFGALLIGVAEMVLVEKLCERLTALQDA